MLFTNLRVLKMTHQAIMSGMPSYYQMSGLVFRLYFLRSRLRENISPSDQTWKLLKFKSMWKWRLECSRGAWIMLCSQLLLVEGADLPQFFSLYPPKQRSIPACLGRTSTWNSTFLEYAYRWVVIQFIPIYALKSDSHYLVYLFITINHVLPCDASYLLCNTNFYIIWFLFIHLST